jgi:hypothetical protein
MLNARRAKVNLRRGDVRVRQDRREPVDVAAVTDVADGDIVAERMRVNVRSATLVNAYIRRSDSPSTSLRVGVPHLVDGANDGHGRVSVAAFRAL